MDYFTTATRSVGDGVVLWQYYFINMAELVCVTGASGIYTVSCSLLDQYSREAVV